MEGEYYLTVVTLCNALVVAVVAIRQYQLSTERFKLDMFDRRYSVYKNTQTFLTKILLGQKIKLQDIQELRDNIQDGVFLFGNDIHTFLKPIDEKAFRLWENERTLQDVQIGEERSKLASEQTDLSKWLKEQSPLLRDKFMPYLAFQKVEVSFRTLCSMWLKNKKENR